MPSVGENSLRRVASRVAADSAPLPFSSQAAVSVKDAPPPVKVWYPVFSSTVMFSPLPPLPAWKAKAGWACRPRTTCRPPASSVVVSQAVTCSPAACAGATAAVIPAEVSRPARSSRRTRVDLLMERRPFEGGGWGRASRE
ncbi:hypothetical protein OV320_3900 [Actinobacteria bacterium OV320]|nr:hypothetical protein OV320_3900 [Actinobacteria bacterium OV320]